MSNPNEIKIADVARAAGVSVSTISRILNNRPDVSEATRQRVKQVIDELGYRPHSQAQRLAAGTTRTIALLNSLDYKYITQLEMGFLTGASTAAGEENYIFNLIMTPIKEADLLGLYQAAQVDGVILMEIDIEDWRVDLLKKNNFPFVMIGHCSDNAGLNFIDLDFENSIIVAFEHLINLGHKEIGFITFPEDIREKGFGPAIRSLRGFNKAQEIFNLSAPFIESRMTVNEIMDSTIELFKENPQLTSIVTILGPKTVGIIRGLRSIGRKVPEDVSIVSISTEATAQLTSPQITSIDFPTYTIGYDAAKMLIKLLNNQPLEMNQILVPPKLIERDSTSPLQS
jgi:DNA-binding LacI/PurR family transcriptional regulator